MSWHLKATGPALRPRSRSIIARGRTVIQLRVGVLAGDDLAIEGSEPCISQARRASTRLATASTSEMPSCRAWRRDVHRRDSRGAGGSLENITSATLFCKNREAWETWTGKPSAPGSGFPQGLRSGRRLRHDLLVEMEVVAYDLDRLFHGEATPSSAFSTDIPTEGVASP